MKRLGRTLVPLMLAAMFLTSRAQAESFDMDQAVAVALARNRDAIAARLEIRSAELDRVAAELYPNPVLSYAVGNLTLGEGNPFNAAQNGAPLRPGLSQTVHSIGINEIIDIWSMRCGKSLMRSDRRTPTSCASSPSAS